MKNERIQLTEAEVIIACERLTERMKTHLKLIGAGVFVHPHEVVGCLYGQLAKLSVAADASIYTDKTEDFEERLFKTALPAVFAIASVVKNREAGASPTIPN